MSPFRRFLALLALVLALPLGVRAAEAPRPGVEILILAREKTLALSSQKTGNYNCAPAVSMGADGPEGFTGAEIWRLEEAGDGSFRILQDGHALSLGESYGYLRLDDAHPFWLPEETDEGWYLKNTGRDLYLYLDTLRGYWGASATPTELTFSVLSQPETPEEPVLPEDGDWNCYFGQLHSHTDFSDGSLGVEEAYETAKQAGLDFFAVTDHSQSFDNADLGELTADAAALSREWARGKAAAQAVTDHSFVGLFGFEMTWNQGQGHMATFGTPGFLSRDRAEYLPYANGMEHYYTALLEAETSISMFCHPGETYGDFKDFGRRTPALDERITLLETDPQGEAYFRALARSWHLAPVALASGHDPDEFQGRTVLLARECTAQALLDAMANCRAYTTEDTDLQILYFLEKQIMGSRISRENVGETVTLTASLSDPTDAALGTLEVLGPGGESLAAVELTGPQAKLQLTFSANRDFFCLRLTQPDGDRALTAPVWLDNPTNMGITALTTEEPARAGSPQTFSLELYNQEREPLEITGITFRAGDAVYPMDSVTGVPAFGTAVCDFTHSFPIDGVYTVTARVSGTYQGQPREFSAELRLAVLPRNLTEDVVLDLSHGYTGDLQQLMTLAADRDIAIHRAETALTAELLETCRLLLIPTPARDFTPEEVRAIRDYVSRGGSLVLCGTSAALDANAAARCNHLLNALGSSMTFREDEARDPLVNGGDPAQLYTGAFGESTLLEHIQPGQTYLQEFGCTLDPGSGTLLVRAEASAGENAVLLALEDTGTGGFLAAAGATFFTDTCLDAGGPWTAPYANRTILEALLGIAVPDRTPIPIDLLRRSETGRMYLTEGFVTAGTANPSTTFPDTIYIQDATGGIAARGYSEHGLPLGARVRILGRLAEDAENPLLEILRLERLENNEPLSPEEAFCAVDFARRGGHLLAVEGQVTAVTGQGDALSRFTLEDVHGDTLDILVEDYIFSGSLARNELGRTVTPGVRVRAVGLLHRDKGQTVLRIRDCDEVTLLLPPGEESNPDTGDGIGVYVLLLLLLPPAIGGLKKICPR